MMPQYLSPASFRRCRVLLFFFFKQKAAYEIKECDWSSDVCSSDLPSRFDAVTAIEKCGIAAQTVIDEGSVRASRRIAKSFAVTEIHSDVADAHFGARPFGAEGNGNAFVRLDIEDQAVGFGFTAAENDMRSALELNDDFGGA